MALTKKDLTDLRQNIQNDLKKQSESIEKMIDQKIDQKVDEGVMTLKVLIEDVRHDLKFVFEAREPHEEKLQNHDKKLKEHDHRIQTLEDWSRHTQKKL